MSRVPTARLFTVDEFYRMADAGILGEDDRVELIDGEIVQLPPTGSRHAACVGRLNRLLGRLVGEAAIVRVQDPLRLNPRSEPLPDLALVRPRDDFYAAGHPGPADTLLVIEVSDSSGRYDRRVKGPLYARAGIPEVWLVDLARERVEAMREPGERSYGTVQAYRRGERLRLGALPQIELGVDELFGERS